MWTEEPPKRPDSGKNVCGGNVPCEMEKETMENQTTNTEAVKNPNKKTFDQQTMRALLRGRMHAPDGYKIASNEISGHSRWSIQFNLVFTEPGQPDGEAWQTSYSQGATESQDESPFEYDTDGVEAFRVKLVEKMVKVWEPVQD